MSNFAKTFGNYLRTISKGDTKTNVNAKFLLPVGVFGIGIAAGSIHSAYQKLMTKINAEDISMGERETNTEQGGASTNSRIQRTIYSRQNKG